CCGRGFRRAGDRSERTLEVIKEEIRRVIEEQYEGARRLLLDNRTALDHVAQALLKYETLTGDEVAAILRGDDLEEYRKAQQRMQAPSERPRRTEVEERTPGLEAQPNEPPGMGLSQA